MDVGKSEAKVKEKVKSKSLSKWPAEPVVGKGEVIILEKQSLFKNTASHLIVNTYHEKHYNH